MAASLGDGDDDITDINVTPLVDVMLVLLIIFMMTTSYIVHKSLEINLPSAETGVDVPQTRNMAFALSAVGTLYLDGKEITYEEVPDLISVALGGAPAGTQVDANGRKVQALITADKATSHGEVIKLIDTVRKNGITDFAINVQAPSDDAQGKDSEAAAGEAATGATSEGGQSG